MHAHARDLRAEGAGPELVDALLAGAVPPGADPRCRALIAHAVLLTRDPRAADAAAVGRLRAVGLADRDVLDLTEVIAYFNYINRIADGLGVDPEEFMPA